MRDAGHDVVVTRSEQRQPRDIAGLRVVEGLDWLALANEGPPPWQNAWR